MSSLHGNGGVPLIASVPVANEDNTNWFDGAADVAEQINSMEGGVSSKWKVKERLLSWTRQAFVIRPRNIRPPMSSEVLFLSFHYPCRWGYTAFSLLLYLS